MEPIAQVKVYVKKLISSTSHICILFQIKLKLQISLSKKIKQINYNFPVTCIRNIHQFGDKFVTRKMLCGSVNTIVQGINKNTGRSLNRIQFYFLRVLFLSFGCMRCIQDLLFIFWIFFG